MTVRYELRRAIADAINDKNQCWPYLDDKNIETVEFRKGCAEIDVVHSVPEHEYKGYATIDAAPVLTALVQALIEEE